MVENCLYFESVIDPGHVLKLQQPRSSFVFVVGYLFVFPLSGYFWSTCSVTPYPSFKIALSAYPSCRCRFISYDSRMFYITVKFRWILPSSDLRLSPFPGWDTLTSNSFDISSDGLLAQIIFGRCTLLPKVLLFHRTAPFVVHAPTRIVEDNTVERSLL